MLPTIFGSCAVGVLIAIVVVLVVRKIVRDKKNGKSLCGGNCSSCPGGCSSRNSPCSGCSPQTTHHQTKKPDNT